MPPFIRFTDIEGFPAIFNVASIIGFAVVEEEKGKSHVLVFTEAAEGGLPVKATMGDIEAMLTKYSVVYRV